MRGSWILFVLVGAMVAAGSVLWIMSQGSGAESSILSNRPLLHAALNGCTAVSLSIGFLLIRGKRIRGHLVCMIAAGLLSLLFLASYVQYHFHAGSMPFRGQGVIRPVYFALLISHTVLAAFVAPIALSLYYFAARREFRRHRGIARWALPLWLYVSITGVLIYLMLYVWFPAA